MYRIKIQLDKIKCIVSINTNMSRNIFSRDTERHSNMQYELHMPVSGECKIDIEKNEYFLKKGNALLIYPGKYHSHIESSDDYIQFVISFQLSASDEVLKTLEKSVSPGYLFDVSEFDVALCERIFKETKEKDLQLGYY